MSWAYLLLAGLLEAGWPIGLKLAQGSEKRAMGIAPATVLHGRQRRAPVGRSA